MKKILLIEDDVDLYALLKYNLEREGFRLVGANTGKGAVELCAREHPDLIVLDIMLPDSDGLDICKRLRSHAELSSIPIIFITARASETDRIVGLELGANDYIIKGDLSFAQIKQLVADHLERTKGSGAQDG